MRISRANICTRIQEAGESRKRKMPSAERRKGKREGRFSGRRVRMHKLIRSGGRSLVCYTGVSTGVLHSTQVSFPRARCIISKRFPPRFNVNRYATVRRTRAARNWRKVWQGHDSTRTSSRRAGGESSLMNNTYTYAPMDEKIGRGYSRLETRNSYRSWNGPASGECGIVRWPSRFAFQARSSDSRRKRERENVQGNGKGLRRAIRRIRGKGNARPRINAYIVHVSLKTRRR